ncbi:MAG: hypothetical protein M3140_08930 [Actinomycetota bacterium]|nr:hypothetical protein [Actinomycetota bacterium]
MSRPGTRFAPPHLSDEAVAAFADGVLRDGARHRAQQHIGECAECRAAVADQRQARSLLRSAPLPCLPRDLLERLRMLPSSAPLGGSPPISGLSADGQPMFAAFGTETSAASDPSDPSAGSGLPTAPPAAAPSPSAETLRGSVLGESGPAATESGHRLHLPFIGLSVAAAATVMVGMVASTAPTAGGGVPAPAGTHAPSQSPLPPATGGAPGGFAPALDLTGHR